MLHTVCSYLLGLVEGINIFSWWENQSFVPFQWSQVDTCREASHDILADWVFPSPSSCGLFLHFIYPDRKKKNVKMRIWHIFFFIILLLYFFFLCLFLFPYFFNPPLNKELIDSGLGQFYWGENHWNILILKIVSLLSCCPPPLWLFKHCYIYQNKKLQIS